MIYSSVSMAGRFSSMNLNFCTSDFHPIVPVKDWNETHWPIGTSLKLAVSFMLENFRCLQPFNLHHLFVIEKCWTSAEGCGSKDNGWVLPPLLPCRTLVRAPHQNWCLKRLWVKCYIIMLNILYTYNDFFSGASINYQRKVSKAFGPRQEARLAGLWKSFFELSGDNNSVKQLEANSQKQWISHHAKGLQLKHSRHLNFQETTTGFSNEISVELTWLNSLIRWWKVIYRSMASGKQVLSACVIVHRSSSRSSVFSASVWHTADAWKRLQKPQKLLQCTFVSTQWNEAVNEERWIKRRSWPILLSFASPEKYSNV